MLISDSGYGQIGVLVTFSSPLAGTDTIGVVMKVRLVDAEVLRALTFDVVKAMGAAYETAEEVATHLVMANLSGHDSHGVIRLPQYVAERDRGQLVPEAETELLRATPVCALFDAHRGFGQRSTMVATEWVGLRARVHGLAAAAIRHSTHIGRLGEYTERLAGEGLVGLVTVGIVGPGSGRVAPFGGTLYSLDEAGVVKGVFKAGRAIGARAQITDKIRVDLSDVDRRAHEPAGHRGLVGSHERDV